VALPRDAKRSTAAPSIDHTFRGSAPEREVKMKVRRSTQEREDLHQQKQEIKEELRHEMRRMRRQITLANAATMAALLALFELAA